MSAQGFVKILETVGIPVATAIALAFGLAKLLTYVLKDQRKDFEGGFKRTMESSEKNRQALLKNEQYIIQLIDRLRVLERNTLLFYSTILSKVNIDVPEWSITRREKIAELKEQIKDTGRGNGDVKDIE